MNNTNNIKYNRIIQKNTFYFVNDKYETKYESNIMEIRDSLLLLKNQIDKNGLDKRIFADLLRKQNGLKSLLTLTGLSKESFKRLVTLIRIVDDPELSKLTLRSKWAGNVEGEIEEWSDSKITSVMSNNEDFLDGIVNLFFEGSTVPFLVRTIPTFDLKKLSISKLSFKIPELLDTLVRYKEKGSYSGKKETNAETVIQSLLESLNITFQKGDLQDLVNNEAELKRTLDFIIPSKKDPKIIIESSYLVTTSSGMGDKAKTEIGVKKLLSKYYPQASFIGFIDGIGWYVRKRDLQRMVKAYDDVFTFHKDEIQRFEIYLKQQLEIEKDN